MVYSPEETKELSSSNIQLARGAIASVATEGNDIEGELGEAKENTPSANLFVGFC